LPMAQYSMRISSLPQILRRYGTSLPSRILHSWSTYGWSGLWARARDALGHHRPIAEFYGEWIERYDTLSDEARRQMREDIAGWATTPLMTVLVPVSYDDPARMRAAIVSCQAQIYPKWQLRISLGAEAPPAFREAITALVDAGDPSRIVVLHSERDVDTCTALNAALAGSDGDFFVLLDSGDLLPEHALYCIAKEIVEHPTADLIFSDEDWIAPVGRRFDPSFKPDWNVGLMLSREAFGRLGAYRKNLVHKVGGFRPEFAECYEYDLVLRCAAATRPERIRHIPRILYHRGMRHAVNAARAGTASTAVSTAGETGCRAIDQYLLNCGVRASAHKSEAGSTYQVEYALPAQPVGVSILLPSRCEPNLIVPCLNSILTRTTYAHYEVLLVVNERHRSSAEALQALTQRANSRVRLLTYQERPFNYSWINNWAANQAAGELLCFLNDDTVVITPDWLERLVARASQPGVAAAGPMLRYPDDSIQHAGVILGLGGVAGHACHGLPQGDCGYLDRACLEQDVSCLTAACLMMRKDVFHSIGGFDEGLPVAYNDVDLCLRARQANWRLIWTPTVELYHRESASVGRHDSPERTAEFKAAVAWIRERWGHELDADPFYNPNLSLRSAYHLAFPPRVAPFNR
jgi:GT2 family glycosyltransferase